MLLATIALLVTAGCNSGSSTAGTADGGLPEKTIEQLQQQWAANSVVNTQPAASPLVPVGPFVANPAWVPIGPNPAFDEILQKQNVSSRGWSILFPNGTPSTILAGSAGGGVWMTTNGGQTWAPKTDNIPARAISTMAADPNSGGQIIYAGTGEPLAAQSIDCTEGFGLIKSVDGGNTWNFLPDPQAVFTGNGIARIVVRPDNSNVYVAVYPSLFGTSNRLVSSLGGIYKSTDGGSTFNSIQFNGSPISDLALQPGTPNTMLAAVNNSALNNSLLNGSLNVGSLPISNDGIWRSTDGGQTWTQSTGLQASSVGFTRISFSPKNPNIVYALVADADFSATTANLNGCSGQTQTGSFVNGLYVSGDAGQTWNFVTTGTTDFRNIIQNAGTNGLPIEPQAPYDLYVTADPNIATTCYVQAQQNARIDNVTIGNPGTATGTPTLIGATDTASNVGQDTIHPHTDQHFLTFDSNGSLYTYCDGGIWRLDSPSTAVQTTPWVDLNGNLQTLQFYSVTISPANPNLVAGGTQDNGSLISMNTNNVISSVWTVIFGGDGGPAMFDAVTGQVLYVSADGGNLAQVSPNTNLQGVLAGGINPCDPASFLFPISVTPANANDVLAGTDRIYQCLSALSNFTFAPATVQLSTDQGLFFNVVAYAPSNPGFIYGILNAGELVVRTSSGGQFSLAQASGLPTSGFNPTSMSVDPNNPSHLFITNGNFQSNVLGQPVSSGLVFESSNAGETFTDVTNQLPNYPALCIVCDPNYPGTVYLGNEIGVYVSVNNGASWSKYGGGLPQVRVWSLAISKSGALAAATHGRAIWETSTVSSLNLVNRSVSTQGVRSARSVSQPVPLGLPIPHQHAPYVPH